MNKRAANKIKKYMLELRPSLLKDAISFPVSDRQGHAYDKAEVLAGLEETR